MKFAANGQAEYPFVITQNKPDNKVDIVYPKDAATGDAVAPHSEEIGPIAYMSAVEYLDLLLKALLLAGVYAAMAVGMTVVYGVMKIVNLAHAGFLMLGAYFAFEMFQPLPH